MAAPTTPDVATVQGISTATSFDASALNGVRLGKIERRVLLAAPGPADDAVLFVAPSAIAVDRQESDKLIAWKMPVGASVTLTPAPTTRSEAESLRRAVRRLVAAGLASVRIEKTATKMVRSYWRRPEVYPFAPRVAVKLTDFGSVIVARHRHALEQGQPIRWTRP